MYLDDDLRLRLLALSPAERREARHLLDAEGSATGRADAVRAARENGRAISQALGPDQLNRHFETVPDDGERT